MPDSVVISGVADLPHFYFAEGAPMRLTVNVGAEFSLTSKFAEFGIRAREGTVRRVFRTDSDESNLSISGQVVSVNVDPADETVPAFSGGWTLADVQDKGATEFWLDFSDTEGSAVLLRLQGQIDWVEAGSDIVASSAIVSAPEIDVTISSGAVAVSVAVTGGEVGIPTGGTDGQVLAKASNSDYDTEWITASGLGTVTSVAVSATDGLQVDSGSPITSSGTITLGVDAATLRSHINVEDGATGDQTASEILTAIKTVDGTGSGLDADLLDGNEASAFESAGAVSTHAAITSGVHGISAFGATLVDDADASTARTTLGVDAAGTDNSTDVTLAGTPDYITISGQVITRNAVDLTTDITGTLPAANGGTGQTSLGAVDAADLGSGAAADGYVLTADGLGGSAWEAAAGGGGSGTVTSVAISGSDGIQVDSGSPITSSGTIALGIDAAGLSSHLSLGDAATKNTGTTAGTVAAGDHTHAEYVAVTGDSMTGDLDLGDNVKATFGADEDMWIYHDGGSSYIYDRGTGNLRIITNSTVSIDGASGAEFMAQFVSNGAVSLYYDNGKKIETASSGVSVTGSLNVTDAATTRTNLGLGTAATSNTGDFEAAGSVSTHAAVTSGVHGISAFGATLVDDADAAAARTTLGLGDAATKNTGTSAGTVAAGDHTHSAFTGDSGSGGAAGFVPAPAAGDAAAGKYLDADGTWTVPAGGGGGSGTKTYAVFTPLDAQPPATNFATLDTRNSIAVLDFDGGSTNEETTFVGILPEAADVSSGLKVRIHWMATSATSGDCRWGVQFEKSGTDLDSDSFDTATEAHSATNATSGIETVTEITATSIDSITAGDRYRIKVYRDASDTTNDTMTGDAELIAVEIRSAV